MSFCNLGVLFAKEVLFSSERVVVSLAFKVSNKHFLCAKTMQQRDVGHSVWGISLQVPPELQIWVLIVLSKMVLNLNRHNDTPISVTVTPYF